MKQRFRQDFYYKLNQTIQLNETGNKIKSIFNANKSNKQQCIAENKCSNKWSIKWHIIFNWQTNKCG